MSIFAERKLIKHRILADYDALWQYRRGTAGIRPLFLCYRRAGVRKLLPCGERRATDEQGAISSAIFDCNAQTDLSACTLSHGGNSDRFKTRSRVLRAGCGLTCLVFQRHVNIFRIASVLHPTHLRCVGAFILHRGIVPTMKRVSLFARVSHD